MTDKITKSARRFARQPGAALSDKAGATGAAETNAGEAAASNPPRPQSKISLITGMLTRSGGACLDELVAATGWQPHTTRAALTGLRKKRLNIAKDKVDGVTRYSITGAAQS